MEARIDETLPRVAGGQSWYKWLARRLAARRRGGDEPFRLEEGQAMGPRTLTALAVSLLVGCSTTSTTSTTGQVRWTHPNSNQGKFDQDTYECKREAAMVPRVAPPSGAPPTAPPRGGFASGFSAGMGQAAYYNAMAEAQASEDRAAELYVLCMRARGYSSQKVSQ